MHLFFLWHKKCVNEQLFLGHWEFEGTWVLVESYEWLETSYVKMYVFSLWNIWKFFSFCFLILWHFSYSCQKWRFMWGFAHVSSQLLLHFRIFKKIVKIFVKCLDFVSEIHVPKASPSVHSLLNLCRESLSTLCW